MESSPQLNEIAAALAAFQAEMPVVSKNHTAEIPTKSGKTYEYSYADLADIIEEAKPHKQKNGLSVFQGVGYSVLDNGQVLHTITTRVLHTSGQWIESTMVIPHLGDIRSLGSSITYGRRYSECAALGIVSDVDDDAELATSAGSNSNATAPPSGSTSTRGRRPSTGDEPESNGNGSAPETGELMTAKNRNALVRHLSQLDPPVRGEAVVKKVQSVLNDKTIREITSLTAAQGRDLFDKLGIVDVVRGGPRPDIATTSPAGQDA
jgi:hypothetical protein